MIHVFNCAKEVCSLPGKVCVECGKVCAQINCQPIRDCCQEAGKCCTSFMDRPLSTYVVVKVGLGIAELGSCYMALQEPTLKNCSLPKNAWVDLATWLNVQMLFAIIHVLAAPYFQRRVWNKLLDFDSKYRDMPEPGAPPIPIPGQVVHDSFKEVFLHDFGILAYAIVLVASYVWSTVGAQWIPAGIPEAACDADGYAGYAYYFGQCFFWLAVIYTGSYYFCSCCASSVELRSSPVVTGTPVE